MDLSKIDFAVLAAKLKESKHKNTDLGVLKAAIRAQLEKLIRLNKTRADFAEKFEELIETYNAGSRNIEELFEELVKLSRNLSEEPQRHVREHMTEEELAIFDILTRLAPELSADERTEVKKVARVLLDRLNQLLVLNWRQKSSARSQLKLAIEDTLDTGLPRAYDKPLYEQKCSPSSSTFTKAIPNETAESTQRPELHPDPHSAEWAASATGNLSVSVGENPSRGAATGGPHGGPAVSHRGPLP